MMPRLKLSCACLAHRILTSAVVASRPPQNTPMRATRSMTATTAKISKSNFAFILVQTSGNKKHNALAFDEEQLPVKLLCFCLKLNSFTFLLWKIRIWNTNTHFTMYFVHAAENLENTGKKELETLKKI